MNNGCKRRLISVYFIGIIIGFILGETEKNINQNIEQATFGAGCFWCVEAVFQDIKGVMDVRSGYTGGTTDNPTYEEVCSGRTGHAEVIQIDFDSNKVGYKELLDLFWISHDPTTLNRQGADVGSQYRSTIYFHNSYQKNSAKKSLRTIDLSNMYDRPIVTEVLPIVQFYPAEEYHQNYYRYNSSAPYCRLVIHPKLNKLFNLE